MFNRFFPDIRYDSAYDVDYKMFYEKGYRNVIFDIDNTLVPHGAPADERAKALVKSLHEIGFKVLFLSNNKEPRVKSFADSVDALYIHKAGKPSEKGYARALRKLLSDKSETIFVGDQIFTDIYGAKRSGIFSILVNQIDKKEEIQIVLKRRLEKPVLFFYGKSVKKSGFPIILTGFMGSGKTTVSKELSNELSLPVIDLDEYIVKKENMPIPEIFKSKGEAYFRKKEYEALKKFSGYRAIIATGGGIVTYKDSFDLLKRSGSVVYLKNDFETLYNRIKGDENRPLANERQETEERFLKRQDLYEGSATVTIECGDLTASEISGLIIRRLHEDTRS